MINSTSYEEFSGPFEIIGVNAVYEILEAIVSLNEDLIRDPGNLSRAKIKYQNRIKKIANKFKFNANKWVEDEMLNSYIAGLKAADYEIAQLGGAIGSNEIINGSSLIRNPPPIVPIPEMPGQTLLMFKGFERHTEFFGVFRAAAYYSIEDMPLQIMRKGDDIFRQVAVQIGERSFKEADILTRRQLSQQFLDEYSKKGIQSIIYRDGRRVSIDNYCEMLGRTLTGRCALQSSLNRYVESGFDLGIVSAHFRACDLCIPYEGKILSLDGRDKRYESVWDAETQGLWHPQCKHDISPFFEGITPEQEVRVDRAEQALIDKYGYEGAQKVAYAAQQQQRYIERKIRQYKRKEILTFGKFSKKVTHRKVEYWQKRQREHLKEHTFLPRKYSREQIKKAH